MQKTLAPRTQKTLALRTQKTLSPHTRRTLALRTRKRKLPPSAPETFATEKLGLETWDKIAEIFRLVDRGERRILVRSCNGAGKTTALAALCNYMMKTYDDSIVLTTASSWTQVRRALWGEIRHQARRAKLFEPKQITSTGIDISDKHYALGISPLEPENAQGFHAPRIFIAIDEATGVSEEIVNALWGNATSDESQMVLIYNPISTDGFPYLAEQSGGWKVVTISAFEHPNVTSGRVKIPGAVTRSWINDRLEAWSYEVGPEEPNAIDVPWNGKRYKKTTLVASRILGEWPDDPGEGLITMDLLRASLVVESVPGMRTLGVDVARGGTDRTVIAKFDGNTQMPFEVFTGRDLMRTANRVKELYDEGWSEVAIDDTGLGGGVTDRLRELGVRVHAVNFNQSAIGILPLKPMNNARSEMYFALEAELRQQSVQLLADVGLWQELTSGRIAQTTSTTFALEDKQSIKKRLGRSPDKADATALARYARVLARYNSRPMFF